jgi:hypothetical protein
MRRAQNLSQLRLAQAERGQLILAIENNPRVDENLVSPFLVVQYAV